MAIVTAKEKNERAKLMAQLGYLAYVVNSETEYCVFLDYSGHVDYLRLEICESKEQYNTKLASSEFYRSDGNVNSWIKSKIDHLKHILDTGNIEYGRMSRVVSQVVSYEF